MLAPSVAVKFAGYNAEEHPPTVASVRAEEVHLIQPQVAQDRLRLRYYIIYPSVTDIQHIVANLDLSLELGEHSDDAFNLRQCQKGSQLILTLDFRPGSPLRRGHLQFFSVTKGQCQVTPMESENLAIPGRYFHAMVGLGKSEVLVAGGYDPETGAVLDDCYVVDTEAQTSRPVSPLPRPLYAPSLTLVGNKVYLFGGACSASPVPNFMALSASLSSSTADRPAGSSPQSPASAPPPQKAYSGPRAAVSSLSDAVYIYDIATDVWEQLDARPCSQTLVSLLPGAGASPALPRAADGPGGPGAAEAARGQRASPGAAPQAQPPGGAAALVPAPRFGHSAAAIFDRYIIVFGGRFSKVCANDMFMLDTHTATWTRLELAGTAPSHRSDAVLIFDGFRCLYVYSGRNSFNSFVDCFAVDLAQGSVTAPGEYREELCTRFFQAMRERYQGVVSARDKRYDTLRAESEVKAAKLMETLQSYIRKAKGLEREREKLSADLAASRGAEAERAKELEALRATLERAEARAAQLDAQLAAAGQEIAGLKAQLSGQQEAAAQLTRTLGERDSTIAELRAGLGERAAEVSSLKAELAARDTMLAERDREKLELSYSCQELDRQKADLLAANSTMEVELLAGREELARLQAVERRHVRVKEEYRRILGDALALNDRFDEPEATMLASSINADRSMNASFTGGMNAASSSGISGAPGSLGQGPAGLPGPAGAPGGLRRKYPVSVVPGLPVGLAAGLPAARDEPLRAERPSSARGMRDVPWGGASAPSRSPISRAALHSSLVSSGPEVDVLGASLGPEAPGSAPVQSQTAQAMQALQALQAGSPIPRSHAPGPGPDRDTPESTAPADRAARAARAADSTGSSVFSGPEAGSAKGALNTVVSPIQSLGN